jgi:transcriptional regulator with XRE-family HTH domain
LYFAARKARLAQPFPKFKSMENNFGTNLRNLRKKNKHTLESLGKALNISKSTLSDYEIGKTSPPINVCEQIANYFEISIDELKFYDVAEKIAPKQTAASSEAGYQELVARNEKSEFQNRILQQQVEGLGIQLKLVRQLVESKDAENRSLRMQIQLLEEKLSEYRKEPSNHS